jgi:hypothetical protein
MDNERHNRQAKRTFKREVKKADKESKPEL